MTYTGTPLAVRRASPAQARALSGIVVVIAYPDFEQIAEQVERVADARRTVEECEERIDGPGRLAVEMQVGGEQAVADAAHFGGGGLRGR